MTIRLNHVLVGIISAVIVWAGPALMALKASDLADPKATLIALGVGLLNAIGVGLVQALVDDGLRITLTRPTAPSPTPVIGSVPPVAATLGDPAEPTA